MKNSIEIALIVAVAKNDVIGREGTILPWHMLADLKRFKKLTIGNPIIMGRKTHQTIGRALPGRTNIIVTHDKSFTAEDCSITHSLDQALTLAKNQDTETIYIIGGGTIYEQALPLADKLYVTEVEAEPEGDTYFRYDSDNWRETERQNHPADSNNDYDYSFVTLTKRQ